jgi:hypothetical protein
MYLEKIVIEAKQVAESNHSLHFGDHSFQRMRPFSLEVPKSQVATVGSFRASLKHILQNML